MKKILLNIILLGCIGLIGIDGFSQTTRLKITVDWENASFQNKVVVQNPGFQDILTIVNPDEPFQTTGTSLIYTAVYDLEFSDAAKDGFDHGYDGVLIIASQQEDMTTLLQDKRIILE